MMRRSVVIAATVAALTYLPGTAVADPRTATEVTASAAASLKRCGSAGAMYGGQLRLTNLRAKRTTCRKARRFARTFTKKSGPESSFTCSEDFYCVWRGWQCRNDGREPGKIKHRCETIKLSTKHITVIKWIDRYEDAAAASEQATACAYASPPDAFPSVDKLAAKRVGCEKARRVARKVQARPYKGTWSPPKRVRAGRVFRCSYRYVTVDFETTYNRAVCKARGGRRVTMRLYS